MLQRINPYLLLLLFSLVLFLPGLVAVPVIDRDEAHFAQASRQMVQTGHYFQIRFQSITRFQKPPGINWLQAATVRSFSDGDSSAIWPYRIPSFLGALGSVLFLYFFARRAMSDRAALLGSALLGSSFLLVVEAHMAVTDASLLFSVILMQGALWVIYQAFVDKKQVHWGWALLFWMAMAYGFLLKGVTPLVGFLSMGALCFIERNVVWLRRVYVGRGLLLFVLVSFLWLMQVNAAEHSNYLLQMFKKDLLPKLQGGHESHGRPPLFHLFSLPLTFWPASLFLWQGAVYAYQQRDRAAVRFLIAWALPTWVFFEIMPTKLPQYVLPTFPALALLCALGLIHVVQKSSSRGLKCLQVLWGVLSLGFALLLSLLPYLLMNEVTFISVLLGFVMGVMSMMSLALAYQQRFMGASLAAVLTACLSFPLLFGGLLPQLKPLWISTNVAAVIPKDSISAERPLLSVGYAEPSLVFAFNTKAVEYTSQENALSILKMEPNRLLLINQSLYEPLMKDLGCLETLNAIKGFNYSAGRWTQLALVKACRRVERTGQDLKKGESQ